MTSEPKAPGASAVILEREELTDDNLSFNSVYMRIKVLTEAGKSQADVEIPYFGKEFSVTDVAGRTIHSDGSVVPFTGKPYKKMIFKAANVRLRVTVFTLPDVQVGSILEYRYKLRYTDLAMAAQWYIQSQIFTRRAHFSFIPYARLHVTISYYLPPGIQAQFVSKEGVWRNTNVRDNSFVLDMNDIAPVDNEEEAPPEHSTEYRVIFYYLNYPNSDAYWKDTGNSWSHAVDKFADHGNEISEAVAATVSPGDTEEQKARKLYAFVQKMENTNYTYVRSESEDKALGLKDANRATLVLARKRGSQDDLALLYLALARASGLHAYAMRVADRRFNLFSKNLLTMSQLDDIIVIVDLGGKDVFVDPGSPYSPFGQLAWQHTGCQGLRQTSSGTAIAETSMGEFRENSVARIADLQLAADGAVSGTLKVQLIGQPATLLRQQLVEKDDPTAIKALEDYVKADLPSQMQVHARNVSSLRDGEKPLIITYVVSGSGATLTGKHILFPRDVTRVAHQQDFSASVRKDPVMLDFPYVLSDQVTLKLPPGVTVASLPKDVNIPLDKFGVLQTKTVQQDNQIVFVRSMAVGNTYYKQEQYPQLREFYRQAQSVSEDEAILNQAATTAAK